MTGCTVNNSGTKGQSETKNSNEVTINGVSFLNPQNLKVSADEIQLYVPDPDISITVRPITEFIQPCVDLDQDRDREVQDYGKLLQDLKEYGKNPKLAGYDSMTCGNTNGNISSEYTKIDGMNAIVYNKALYQEVGSLSTFYKQVIFVDQYDQVYDIVFNYDFGKLGEYLAKMRGDDIEAYAYENTPENWASGKIEEAWQEVIDYFEKGKPISSEDLKGFEENEKVINEVIKSIKVKPNEVIKTPSVQSASQEDSVEAPLKEAFISVPKGGVLKRSKDNAFYINGTTSDNCEKITVTAMNPGAGIQDKYDLKNYKKGDTTFRYGIREDWNNLGFGYNNYIFQASCDDSQFVSDTTAINIQKINYSATPTKTITTFWDGYQWASDNNVSSFDICQNEFGTGFAENGCNQYIKDNYTGYNTFHGSDCTEDCSGHEAGYEWAEDNDIRDTYDCESNSDSFIEGCEAYVEENY